MPDLEGSRTEQNLIAAFARESGASRRYLHFAQRADIEGQPEVAALFRSVADGETGHALDLLEILTEVADPETGMPAETVEEHLASAAAGEAADAAIYPTYAATARDEGFQEIAEWLEALARAEQKQAERFQAALDGLTG